MVIGAGFKGNIPDISEFIMGYEEWKKQQEKTQDSQKLRQIVKLLIPPIFLPALSAVSTLVRRLTRRFT
jgi:hypothetical protein